MKPKVSEGQQYGKLTVEKKMYVELGKTYWYCQCDCGNTRVVTSFELRSDLVTMCLEEETKQKLKKKK